MLPREFYQRDTVTVAKQLLGKKIVRKIKRSYISGIITETEAYKHTDDSASHAYQNITKRNKVMFGTVGVSYVYFTYGMHYCFNVVAKSKNVKAGAVLIRAIHPQKGISIMQKNRDQTDMKNLTNGPAKLAQAMQITKDQYGLDITQDPRLYITKGIEDKKIVASPRVGIKSATEKLWNFKITI